MTNNKHIRQGCKAGAVLMMTAGAVGMLASGASAHNGTVEAAQDCDGWQASVTLNHNVTENRTVEVVTTIPGTEGLVGHFDSSYGQVWAAHGTEVTHGRVTLNIYTHGRVEFTASATLPPVEHCSPVPTTSTTELVTTTTARRVVTTTSAPATSTTFLRLVPPVTATAPPALPRTGSGPLVWVGFVTLLAGAALLVGSRNR